MEKPVVQQGIFYFSKDVCEYLSMKHCTCVHPLRNSARKPVQPLAKASMPSRVIWSHHDRFNISSILQPSLNTLDTELDVWQLVLKTWQVMALCWVWLKPTWEPWGSGYWWTHRKWDLAVWVWSKTCWGWGRCCLWSWCSRSDSTLRCFCSSGQMSWETVTREKEELLKSSFIE